MREWEAFVPEEERKVYEKAGYTLCGYYDTIFLEQTRA